MNTDNLSVARLIQLGDILEIFERYEKKASAVSGHSGGFTRTDYTGFDKDNAYFTLTWGIQSDVQDTVHKEDYELAWNIVTDMKMPSIEKINYIYLRGMAEN